MEYRIIIGECIKFLLEITSSNVGEDNYSG
jgi:hypothetical protein